ncbi:Folate-like transporter 2 [Aphelenchoides fujianensis]|nr:Folate-like transporter 2 [Aphelenchoides fujianensis]
MGEPFLFKYQTTTLGYLASQVIILTQLGDYLTLNIIAFCMPCFVLLFCIFMPRVHWKRMVERMVEAKRMEFNPADTQSRKQWRRRCPNPTGNTWQKRVRTLRSDLTLIYRSAYIRRWSLYWALGTAMSLQVALLSQTLWGEVQTADMKESPMNGFAEAGYTFVATISILCMNSFAIDWDKWGEAILVLISVIDTIILVIYSQSQSIWVMYGCYIAYRSLYQVMVSIAQWNIAKKMDWVLGIREQYLVYGGCHFVIGLIFFCSTMYTLVHYLVRRPKIADSNHAQIFSTSTPSLAVEDDALKKEAIRSGVDMVEQEDLVSSTATSDTESGGKSDAESQKSVRV